MASRYDLLLVAVRAAHYMRVGEVFAVLWTAHDMRVKFWMCSGTKDCLFSLRSSVWVEDG